MSKIGILCSRSIMAVSRPVELLVLSNVNAYSIQYSDKSRNDPICDPAEISNDAQDQYNHPRKRRAIILGSFLNILEEGYNSFPIRIEHVVASVTSSAISNMTEVYKNVHSLELITFLVTSWKRWVDLGEHGRDPSGYLQVETDATNTNHVPALVPPCFPLPRDPYQVPSESVLGQAAYYNTGKSIYYSK
jgi:hypothetical protein